MEQKDKEYNHYFPTIYTEESIGMLQYVPVLDNEQIYIYVILNSSGNVKIGKTTNIENRIRSLSGSNAAGERIISVYVSPATWIHSIEGTCHNHYHYARIGGEWFDGCKVEFDEVVEYVDGLFRTDGYDRCNKLRRQIIEGKINDNQGN